MNVTRTFFCESSIQSNQCSLIPEQLTLMNGLIIHQYNDCFSFKDLK